MPAHGPQGVPTNGISAAAYAPATAANFSTSTSPTQSSPTSPPSTSTAQPPSYSSVPGSVVPRQSLTVQPTASPPVTTQPTQSQTLQSQPQTSPTNPKKRHFEEADIKDDLEEGTTDKSDNIATSSNSRWPSLSILNPSATKNNTNATNPNKKFKTDAELMPPPSKAISDKILKQIEEKRAQRQKQTELANNKKLKKSSESGLLKLVDYGDEDEKYETTSTSSSLKAPTQPFWSSHSANNSWNSKYVS